MRKMPVLDRIFPGQQGMALILVLWVVAALTIFCASLGSVVRQEAALGGVQQRLMEGRAVGEAAIFQVLQRMAFGPSDFKKFETVSVPTPGRVVDVDIIPWSGLVNINGAPPELLSLVLVRGASIGRTQADALSQAIAQARMESGKRRMLSVAWEAPEDLLQVPGVTYSIYAGIRDYIVADVDGRSGINIEAAPPALRDWLESADAAAAYRQNIAGSRYTLVAKVRLEDAGMAQIIRQVDVQGGSGKNRLPWVILSAAQIWAGHL